MTESSFYALAIGVLVVWRVTHLFYGEDGPWDAMVRLRRFAGNGIWGSLLDCFYCLSLWVAIPFAYVLADRWKARLLLWPALSAGAILLERVTTREAEAPPTSYADRDQEERHVLR